MGNKNIDAIEKGKMSGGQGPAQAQLPERKKITEFTDTEKRLIIDTYMKTGQAKGTARLLAEENQFNVSQSRVLNLLRKEKVVTHRVMPRISDEDTTDIGILDNQDYKIHELMVIFGKSRNKIYETINTYSAKKRKEAADAKENSLWGDVLGVFQSDNGTDKETYNIPDQS